jgi:hypothetical protein
VRGPASGPPSGGAAGGVAPSSTSALRSGPPQPSAARPSPSGSGPSSTPSSSGSSTAGPDRSTPGGTPGDSPLPGVAVVDNELRFIGDRCVRGPLHMFWIVLGLGAGDEVVVRTSLRGVQADRTFTTAVDGSFGANVSTGGNGLYTTRIVSIADRPAPAAGSTNRTTVSGCP